MLQPEISKYHTRLSKKRREELKERIGVKVQALGGKLKAQLTNEKSLMDGKQVFHPNANAQRAHSALLVKLQRTLSPEMMEDLVLKEMIADDKRNLTSEEIANLNNRFGKLFQGTAFGGILEVQKNDKIVDPEVEIAQKLVNAAPVDPRLPLSTSATKSAKELRDQSVLDYEEFKVLSPRSSTRGGAQAQNSNEKVRMCGRE